MLGSFLLILGHRIFILFVILLFEFQLFFEHSEFIGESGDYFFVLYDLFVM
jgi:hypothetical protein